MDPQSSEGGENAWGAAQVAPQRSYHCSPEHGKARWGCPNQRCCYKRKQQLEFKISEHCSHLWCVPPLQNALIVFWERDQRSSDITAQRYHPEWPLPLMLLHPHAPQPSLTHPACPPPVHRVLTSHPSSPTTAPPLPLTPTATLPSEA